jgi:hypothetical protein
MVFPQRRALRARLRPFRYVDGIYYGLVTPNNAWGDKDKVMAGGDPGQPCLVGERLVTYSRRMLLSAPFLGSR